MILMKEIRYSPAAWLIGNIVAFWLCGPEFNSMFFYIRVLFHDMYGLGVSMFCPILSSKEAPAFCSPKVRGESPIVSMWRIETLNPRHGDKWYNEKLRRIKYPSNEWMKTRREFGQDE